MLHPYTTLKMMSKIKLSVKLKSKLLCGQLQEIWFCGTIERKDSAFCRFLVMFILYGIQRKILDVMFAVTFLCKVFIEHAKVSQKNGRVSSEFALDVFGHWSSSTPAKYMPLFYFPPITSALALSSSSSNEMQ